MRHALVSAVVCTGVVVAMTAMGVTGPPERAVSDLWRGSARGDTGAVVIVAVDDESLERIEDPLAFWAPHFGKAVTTLRASGASVIGLDFLFKVSAEDWLVRNGFGESALSRVWDAPLRAALAHPDVVVAASAGPDGVDLPLGPYLAVLPDPGAQLGLSNLPLESDGVLRRFQPVIAEGSPALSFGLALALLDRSLFADEERWELGGRVVERSGAPVEIAWRGPPGTVERIPFWKLVEEGAWSAEDADRVRGRVALIGATFGASQDTFLTPHLRTGQGAMPGIEVHANVVATLLEGGRVGPVPLPGVAGLIFAGALAVAVATARSSLRGSVLVLGAVLLAWVPIGALAYSELGALLPTVSGILAPLAVFAASWPLRFASEHRERRALHESFRRYLPPEVLAEILAHPGKIGLGGRRRPLTILVADIRGFTTLSEKLSPEEVVELLNAWFARACAPVLRHGGVVDKFLGDGILAVFGAPVGRADHARAALLAAIEMAEAARSFAPWVAERFSGHDVAAFGIGIGVHTGEAVSGTIGFELRTEYTVIGDTVNTAARIEGLTRSLGCVVLASRAALDAAGPGVRTGVSATLPLKGKAREVEVVEVLGA